LELIRNNSSKAGSDSVKKPPAASLRTRFKTALGNRLALKKAFTIGIDIGYDDLKMVKIGRATTPKYEMIDYTRVPYEPEIKPAHDQFPAFLKKHISRFSGGLKHVDIWSNISSAQVELRYLRIPKVPPKQIANAVYWSHKKIAPHKDEEVIFDYEVLGEVFEEGAPKLAVISFTAPRDEIQFQKNLFVRAGYPLKGLSIVPFSFQNLLRTGWVRTDVKNVSSLYIGRDWSRIDIFSEGNLLLSRGIKAGIKTMNEAMRGEMNGKDSEDSGAIEMPADLMDQAQSEAGGPAAAGSRIDTEKAQQIFFGLIHDVTPATQEQLELQPEEEQVFRMIMPALERLVQQVERTFEHYTSHFNNQRVEKLFISSTIRPHRRIVDYIGDELGLPRETFDPFTTDLHFLGNVSGPVSDAERGAFAPAIGMALSDNAITPNFLYTYKEKAKAARNKLLNKVAMIVFFIVLAGCFGFYSWQGRLIAQKQEDKAALQTTLNSFKEQVDQKKILDLVEQNKKKNEQYREFSRKYIGIVVLTEISNLTPSNVRLTNISVQLSDLQSKQAENSENTEAAAAGKPKKLLLEGIILGERMAMKAALTDYLWKLSGSPLFEEPDVQEEKIQYFGPYQDKEVLKFSAFLNLLS
jgi:type IV pilus assembly protein PilM